MISRVCNEEARRVQSTWFCLHEDSPFSVAGNGSGSREWVMEDDSNSLRILFPERLSLAENGLHFPGEFQGLTLLGAGLPRSLQDLSEASARVTANRMM